MIARCNLCTPVDRPQPVDGPVDDGVFRVPWDEVGKALMEQHLLDSHGATQGLAPQQRG